MLKFGLLLTLPPSSSMVIRDLTLRSAASFGSFHLIRLLYDEYMYYLVEQRVAKFRNTDPVVVMGEVRSSCPACTAGSSCNAFSACSSCSSCSCSSGIAYSISLYVLCNHAQ